MLNCRLTKAPAQTADDSVGKADMDNGNDVKLSAKKRRALETVSVSRNEKHPQTAISSADGAKVLNNLDNLVKDYENTSQTKEKTFVGEVANSLGINAQDKSSKYATFETKNGKIVTIRLSNHNATVSNFDQNGEADGISIVVSPKENNGVTNDGNAHVVKYYYDAIKLRKAEGKPLADIVRSIKQALYSGEFKDTTGLTERQEVNADEMMPISEKNETMPEEEFSKKHKRKNKGKAKNIRQPKKKTYRDADGNWNTRQLIADTAIDNESIGEDMMPQSLKKAFGRAAKMLGVRIQFLDLASVDSEGDMPNGWYSGRDRGEGYENGTVYLSNNPAKAVEFVFGYEMTHEIKNSDAAAYERLKAMARSMMGGAVWSQRIARAHALYEGTKGYDSEEDFEEEVVADFIGMMVNDGNMIEDIARRADRPVLSSLARAVEKVKQWFTGDFYGRMIGRVQDAIERAMSGDAVGQERGGGGTGNARKRKRPNAGTGKRWRERSGPSRRKPK